jgi:hypothetical protein
MPLEGKMSATTVAFITGFFIGIISGVFVLGTITIINERGRK